MVKNLPANTGDARDMGLIPGSGRSPGGGHGSPLQYSAWWLPWTEEPSGVTVRGVAALDLPEHAHKHLPYALSLGPGNQTKVLWMVTSTFMF